MNYLEHWYRALRSPAGVVLRTDDPLRLKQRLYTARKEVMDPQLDSISIVTSPTSQNELWLVRRDGQAEIPGTVEEGDIEPL